jgi:hypothetical protein
MGAGHDEKHKERYGSCNEHFEVAYGLLRALETLIEPSAAVALLADLTQMTLIANSAVATSPARSRVEAELEELARPRHVKLIHGQRHEGGLCRALEPTVGSFGTHRATV